MLRLVAAAKRWKWRSEQHVADHDRRVTVREGSSRVLHVPAPMAFGRGAVALPLPRGFGARLDEKGIGREDSDINNQVNYLEVVQCRPVTGAHVCRI